MLKKHKEFCFEFKVLAILKFTEIFYLRYVLRESWDVKFVKTIIFTLKAQTAIYKVQHIVFQLHSKKHEIIETVVTEKNDTDIIFWRIHYNLRRVYVVYP